MTKIDFCKTFCAFFLVIPLTGCGETKVSCSSKQTTDVVEQIARKQMEKNPAAASMFDSQSTKISIDVIRTRTSTDRAAQCVAEIKFDIALRSVESGKLIDSSSPEMKAFKASIENEVNKPIEYSVERTDKGDQIYVNVRGLVSW